MRWKWIPMGLIAGLLAAAVAGGAVLASGGDPGGSGKPVAVVAAEGPGDLETRIAEILGTEPQATGDAFAQVNSIIEVEYVDAVLEKAVEGGHITAERAQEIRSQVQSGDYSGLDQLWEDSYLEECGAEIWFQEPEAYQEYPDRVAAILNVDSQSFADALDQASKEWYAGNAGAAVDENGMAPVEEPYSLAAKIAEILGTDPQATADAMKQVEAEIEAEYVDALLRAAVESGRITTEQADDIRARVQSGDYYALDELWQDGLEECIAEFWFEAEAGISQQEYYERVGAILDVDGQKVADAVDQALEELYQIDLQNWDNESGPVEQQPAGSATAGAPNG